MDLPLSTSPIIARRASDNAVSSAFGARGCAVHSPSGLRPGSIADRSREQFEALGFPLACANVVAGTRPALLEVFPHIALLALMNAPYRVPYKISRTSKYWPTRTTTDRRRLVIEEWRRITRALAGRIGGWSLDVPPSGTFTALKRYEDALDALVCAWVGIEYVEGRGTPYGDARSAIWNPS